MLIFPCQFLQTTVLILITPRMVNNLNEIKFEIKNSLALDVLSKLKFNKIVTSHLTSTSYFNLIRS